MPFYERLDLWFGLHKDSTYATILSATSRNFSLVVFAGKLGLGSPIEQLIHFVKFLTDLLF